MCTVVATQLYKELEALKISELRLTIPANATN